MSAFFGVLMIPAALFGGYIYHWLLRLLPLLRRRENTRKVRLLLLLPAAALAALSVNLPSLSALFLLHFWFLSALAELAGWLLKKLWRKHPPFPGALRYAYRLSLVPLLLSAVLLSYGVWNMAHVQETYYTLEIGKGPYRIAFLSDTHYGTIQDPAVLRDVVARINAAAPDLVILGGDIVEDGTSAQAMEEAFSTLGGLSARCGVYYIYGNHDRQFYSRKKGYSAGQLTEAIEKNGIRILEDDTVCINGELLVVGRGDAGWSRSERPSVAELVGEDGRDKVVLVADHQPKDLAQNGLDGADVQLSGHTHAGQIWPVDLIERLMGMQIYGRYEENGCTLFLSSGVAGWGFPVRTCGHCEYVILDLLP